jgi:5-methylcytosine-specific restriction endonuclease McrA
MRVGGYRWIKLRKEFLKECNYTCKKCGKKFNSKDLIVDHITPISLGGKEFDKKNFQCLCKGCNKVKTKIDLSVIFWINKFPPYL